MGIEVFCCRCNLKKKKIDIFIGFNKIRIFLDEYIYRFFSIYMYIYIVVEGNICIINCVSISFIV